MLAPVTVCRFTPLQRLRRAASLARARRARRPPCIASATPRPKSDLIAPAVAPLPLAFCRCAANIRSLGFPKAWGGPPSSPAPGAGPRRGRRAPVRRAPCARLAAADPRREVPRAEAPPAYGRAAAYDVSRETSNYARVRPETLRSSTPRKYTVYLHYQRHKPRPMWYSKDAGNRQIQERL